MFAQFPNLGRWLSSGMSVHPWGGQREVRPHRTGWGGVGRRWPWAAAIALRPASATVPLRLFTAAVLAATTILSPGACGACAGCCDDGPPPVAAPLAAGIAPVHTPAPPGGHVSCCDCAAAESRSPLGTRGPAEECQAGHTADCGCLWGPHGSHPSAPAPDDDGGRQSSFAPHVPALAAIPPGRIAAGVRVDGGVPIPTRPLRVLYGVWRN